ncbi:MAG: TM2 domain-containing protein, partial [Burkholderiales bacterium]|nr:TM2 domain-containing protein [Burkholderiales bacterium]
MKPLPPARSKTLAAWLAVVLGWLGAHRFYLRGASDRAGWLYPLPSLLGLWGLWRVHELGQDDRLAWLLVPLLGLAITAAMLSAITYALTP